MCRSTTKHLTLSAMFLTIGMLLPFLFGQIPQIGTMLLPMHIPVFLCAFVCGPQYGAAVAVILPLLRSLLFSRPLLYPDAFAIALEMATYALVAGLLYRRSRWHCIRALYRSLLVAMVAGRVVRTVAQILLLGLRDMPFRFESFFGGVILAGLPGIVLQLTVIPTVMLLLQRTKLMPHRRLSNQQTEGGYHHDQ